MVTWLHLLYNWSYLIKFCWWCHGSKLLHQNFTSELLLNVAEDNHYCIFFSLAIWVFSFIYFIDFGYFIIFSSEEQSYYIQWAELYVVNLRETQRTSKLNINFQKNNVNDIVLVYDILVKRWPDTFGELPKEQGY